MSKLKLTALFILSGILIVVPVTLAILCFAGVFNGFLNESVTPVGLIIYFILGAAVFLGGITLFAAGLVLLAVRSQPSGSQSGTGTTAS